MGDAGEKEGGEVQAEPIRRHRRGCVGGCGSQVMGKGVGVENEAELEGKRHKP